MSKDPAVLFYTSDFLTGTFTMTDDQVGKYIRLLCLQHQKGFLCENDMLKICKTYDNDIYSKFIKEGDKYYNDRMKIEADKRKKYSESRKANRESKPEKPIKKGKIKGKIISESYDKHMDNENVIINDIDITAEVYKKVTAFYFEFYKNIVGNKPAFGGAEGSILKKLLMLIKKSMIEKDQEITPDSLFTSFKFLFENLPDWYKSHLDIKNVYGGYDKINAEIASKKPAKYLNPFQQLAQ